MFQTDQGIKNLTGDKAQEISGTDPDYAMRDLYNSIASGKYVRILVSLLY